MTNAPERIWAFVAGNILNGGWCNEPTKNILGDEAIEYVRADIHRAAAMQYLADAGQAADLLDALQEPSE